jgi:hypothetical protein
VLRHILAIVERCAWFHGLKTERMLQPDVCTALAESGRITRSIMMRIILSALAVATAAALATPAYADPAEANPNYGGEVYAAAPVVGGAAAGTAVGVGLYNGWYTGAAAAALPATAAGAAATGGVAGVGTFALIDSVLEPCRGFAAVFGANSHECVNGAYVGDQPRIAEYHHGRRRIMR